MTLSLSISIKNGICCCYIYHLSAMITVLTRFLNLSAFKTYSKVMIFYCSQEPNRDFKQIATVTSTTAVVDAKSWAEYVTVACQISIIREQRPNSDFGVSCRFLFSRSSEYATRQVFAMKDLTLPRKLLSKHAHCVTFGFFCFRPLY